MPRPSSGRAASAGPRSAVRWSPVLGVLVAVATSVLGGAQPAQAHTSLVSSSPTSSAAVADPLEVVTLVFSQPVSPRQVQVVVSGPDGADVAHGPAQVSGATVTRAVGSWPSAGSYRLAYRVLAEDGHPITGEVPFTVTSAAVSSPATPTATTTGPPTPDAAAPAPPSAPRPAGTNLVPVLVAVLGAVAVALVVGAVRAGRRPETGP